VTKSRFEKAVPYLIGVAAFLAIMVSYAGLSRSLWWFGLTIGAAIIGVVGMRIADAKGEESVFGLVAKLVSVMSLFVAAALLLFGCIVVAKVFISPFWPSSYSDNEPPENWGK
jgi:predicted alpha/beta hydrolase